MNMETSQGFTKTRGRLIYWMKKEVVKAFKASALFTFVLIMALVRAVELGVSPSGVGWNSFGAT